MPEYSESETRFQEFVKGIREQNSGQYALTGSLFKQQMGKLIKETDQSSDDIVDAIEASKNVTKDAGREVVGTNRSILTANTNLNRLSKVQIKSLNQISASLAATNQGLLKQFVFFSASLFPLVGNFFLPSRRMRAERRQAKQHLENLRIQKATYDEQKSTESFTEQITFLLVDVKEILYELLNKQDRNKLREIEEKREEDRKKLEPRSKYKVNETALFGRRFDNIFAEIVILIGALAFSFVQRLSLVVGTVWKTIKGFFNLKFIKNLKPIKWILKQVETIKNTLKFWGRAFGRLGVALKAIKFSKLFFGPISFIVKTLRKIGGFVGKFFGKGSMFGGLFKVIKRFAIPFNIIFAAFETITGIFKGIGLSDEVGVNKTVGGFVGAIGGFLEFLTFGFLDFEAFFKDVAPSFQGIIDSIMSGDVFGVIENVFALALDIPKHILSAVSDMFGAVVEAITNALAWVLELFGVDGQWLRDFGKTLGDGFRALSDGIVKVIDFIKTIPRMVLDFFVGIWDFVGHVFGAIGDTIKYYMDNPLALLDKSPIDVFSDMMRSRQNAKSTKVNAEKQQLALQNANTSKDNLKFTASKDAVFNARYQELLDQGIPTAGIVDIMQKEGFDIKSRPTGSWGITPNFRNMASERHTQILSTQTGPREPTMMDNFAASAGKNQNVFFLNSSPQQQAPMERQTQTVLAPTYMSNGDSTLREENMAVNR